MSGRPGITLAWPATPQLGIRSRLLTGHPPELPLLQGPIERVEGAANRVALHDVCAPADERRPGRMELALRLGVEEHGFEIARRLRADPATKGMKLVALSGYGSERDIELGREAGFDAHLVKPVDLAEVEKLLASSSHLRSR